MVRAVPTVRPVLISFVVRLSPAVLTAGDLAGEVEHVPTGERGQFRDAVELTHWCARFVVPAPRGTDPFVIALDPASTPSVRKSSS